tara:strand:- start:4667 stop:5074 length:408 start_codon:yes stop_codon:yes gene_type:complete
MTDCIFCKIIKGEIPCSKIYEDDKAFAFLDIAPVNKGHALVIPKEHHETFEDLPENLTNYLLGIVKKIGSAVKKGVNADGYNIGMNIGKAAGQLVFHAHWHIIPRFNDDGLKTWPQKEYDDKEMDKYKEQIVKFL